MEIEYEQVMAKQGFTKKENGKTKWYPPEPLVIDGEPVFIKKGTIAVRGKFAANQKTQTGEHLTKWALNQHVANGNMKKAVEIIQR